MATAACGGVLGGGMRAQKQDSGRCQARTKRSGGGTRHGRAAAGGWTDGGTEIIEEAKEGRREKGDKQGLAPLGLITSLTHTHTPAVAPLDTRNAARLFRTRGPSRGSFSPLSLINKLAAVAAGGVTRDHGTKKQRGDANNISQGI